MRPKQITAVPDGWRVQRKDHEGKGPFYSTGNPGNTKTQAIDGFGPGRGEYYRLQARGWARCVRLLVEVKP